VITQKGTPKQYVLYGTDTISFEVNPNLFLTEKKEKYAIKLVDYQHSSPQKKE
jgi:hypothetical protein